MAGNPSGIVNLRSKRVMITVQLMRRRLFIMPVQYPRAIPAHISKLPPVDPPHADVSTVTYKMFSVFA